MPSAPSFLDFFFLGDIGLTNGKGLHVLYALALKNYPAFGYKKNRDAAILVSEKRLRAFQPGHSYRAPVLVAEQRFQRWAAEEPLFLPEIGEPSPLDARPDLNKAVEAGAAVINMSRILEGQPALSYPKLIEAAEKMLNINHAELATQEPPQPLRAPRKLGKPLRRPKGKGRPYDVSF